MKNNRNIAILFFTMIVVMMGFGMVIPILPFYIESFGASGQDLGLLMAIFSLMQFIFAPIWGTLSDRIGRKPLLVIGALGNALSLLFFGLASQMWMMYLARAFGGILSAATLPTAMAFIGDTTDEKNRGGGMGVIGAAMGVGMVLGPGLGGTLASYDLSVPFFVASGLSLLAVILILLVLPESLPVEKRQTGAKISGPQFNLLWKSLWGPLGFLLILAFIVSFGLTSFEGVFGLYAQHRYDYNPTQVGLVMTVVGLVSAFSQGLLTGPLTKRFGEVNLIKVSLITSALGFVLMLTPNTAIGVYLTVGFFVLSNSMLRPAISSIISKEAESGQGVAMGLNNSFMSLGRIIGPIWAGTLFDLHLSGPYISGAVVMGIVFLSSMIWLRPKRHASIEAQTEPAMD